MDTNNVISRNHQPIFAVMICLLKKISSDAAITPANLKKYFVPALNNQKFPGKIIRNSIRHFLISDFISEADIKFFFQRDKIE